MVFVINYKNFFLLKIRTKITFLYADKANLNNLGPNYYKSNQEFSYIVSNGTVIKESSSNKPINTFRNNKISTSSDKVNKKNNLENKNNGMMKKTNKFFWKSNNIWFGLLFKLEKLPKLLMFNLSGLMYSFDIFKCGLGAFL